MWILALDVGMSSIRAIGYDALGRPLAGAVARVGFEPATTPDGGSELDAVPLEVLPGTEASSRGAARLALGALGCPGPPPEPSGAVVRPDSRRRDIYAAARARQSGLYDRVVGPPVS